MWIARYDNGKTITQKEMDYADLEHSRITSLQLKFRGAYYTLSKSDKSQQFLQQRSGRKSMQFSTKKGVRGDIVRGNIPLVKQHIFLVYNNEGDCMGWEVDHTSGETYEKEGNVLDMRTNLDIFDIRLEDIKGNTVPILTSYKMRSDSERVSASIGVKIQKDK